MSIHQENVYAQTLKVTMGTGQYHLSIPITINTPMWIQEYII